MRKISLKARGVKKCKTHSSVKKRFKVTGSGLIVMSQANKQHNMIKHSSRQKKAQSGTVIASSVVARFMKKFFRLGL